MDVFSFITLFGGLAFFLYGMNVMSSGLERLAGSNLERYLRKITKNRFAGLALGMGVTAVIQSSSAVTVMLVGLVNSGIMQLSQAIGVIMGSNIGTTVTSWILSLTGLEGDNFIIRLLKPESFSLIFAVFGAILLMMPNKGKRRDIGGILLGFAILMYGMKMMSGAVSPLTDSPMFVNILTLFNNPFFGVLAGIVFTAIIQSSSASVGVLQALSTTGSMTFGMAIPIILGQNIGTCVTALLSCIGTGKNAKKVAVVHLSFNIIGTVLFLSGFYIINAIFPFPFMGSAVNGAGIAIVHTIFNLSTTIVLFPFAKLLEKLADFIIRGSDKKEVQPSDIIVVDDRILAVPAFAVTECATQIDQMAKLADETITMSLGLLKEYNAETGKTVFYNEERLDQYEDALGTALVKIAGKELTKSDSHQVSVMLHTIGDLERLGDHALNLKDVAEEIYEKKIVFSDNAKQELDVVISAVENILAITMDAFRNCNTEAAVKVEPLEQVIDELVHTIKHHHIDRLTNGECTIELGFVLTDLLSNLERVSDHCSNIAAAMLEIERDSFETHQYLNEVKYGGEKDFVQYYNQFLDQYRLESMEAKHH